MNETKTNPTVNYFLDTEFYEDGKTIELISICLVSEFGECVYMENAEFDWSTVPSGHWLRVNVKPSLKEIPEVLFTKQAIAERIIKFVDTESVNPLFWGYYSDYDWVVLCQLFGTMVQLPKGFPMFCLDLKQSLHERFLGKGAMNSIMEGYTNPDEHSAMADAEWNRQLWARIYGRREIIEYLVPATQGAPCMNCEKKKASVIPDLGSLRTEVPLLKDQERNDGITEPTNA